MRHLHKPLYSRPRNAAGRGPCAARIVPENRPALGGEPFGKRYDDVVFFAAAKSPVGMRNDCGAVTGLGWMMKSKGECRSVRRDCVGAVFDSLAFTSHALRAGGMALCHGLCRGGIKS